MFLMISQNMNFSSHFYYLDTGILLLIKQAEHKVAMFLLTPYTWQRELKQTLDYHFVLPERGVKCVI